MNRKFFSLFCLALVLTASLVSLAFPHRGASSARQISIIDGSAPINFWSWPTAAISTVGTPSKTPKTVWTPELGTWYLAIARNGYVFVSRTDEGEWWDSGVTTRYESGYSVGAFLDLPAGHYVLKCEVDGPAQFEMAFYGEVGNGYLWSSAAIMSAQSYAGLYERTFTVPSDDMLTLLIPTSRNTSAPPLTVTNIEIYRLD